MNSRFGSAFETGHTVRRAIGRVADSMNRRDLPFGPSDGDRLVGVRAETVDSIRPSMNARPSVGRIAGPPRLRANAVRRAAATREKAKCAGIARQRRSDGAGEHEKCRILNVVSCTRHPRPGAVRDPLLSAAEGAARAVSWESRATAA